MYKVGDKLKSKYYPDTIFKIYDIMDWSKYIDIEVISGPGINIENNIQVKYLAVTKPQNTVGTKGTDIIDFEVIKND